MTTSTAQDGHDHDHAIPLWGLFLALLAFTAAEVGIYELWRHTAMDGNPFIPKVAMVLLILFVLTLPKALIVLSYFMHLKFEKQFVIALAVLPFVLVAVVVVPTLVDARVNVARTSDFVRPDNIKGYNQQLRDEYNRTHGHGPATDQTDSSAEQTPQAQPEQPAPSDDPYSY